MSSVARYQQIQILRAIAALFVVVDHSIYATWPNDQNLIHIAWCFGDLGVGMFFVISGFIMAHIAYDRPTGVQASLEFAQRRLHRLAPLYWIATLLVLAKFLYIRHFDTATSLTTDFIKSVFFLPFRDERGLYRPLLSSGWTLNYEMFFYLVFSITLLLKSAKASLFCCCAILLLTVGFGFAAQPHKWTGEPENLVEFYSHPIIILFAVGMTLRVMKLSKPLKIHFTNPAMLAASAPAGVALAFILFGVAYPIGAMGTVLIWCACAASVGVALNFDNPKRSASRLAKALAFFGDASYSTYLFQSFAFVAVKFLQDKGHWRTLTTFCVCLVCAHIFGALAYLGIERPLLRRRAQIWRGAGPAKGETQLSPR